jgi:acetyl-CoA carboxylase beta subunit
VTTPVAGPAESPLAGATPEVTIEREIAEVIRGSYARAADPPAKRRIGARELLSEVLDNDSFVSWDTGLVSIPASDEYLNQLAEARQTSGLDEAVMTGEGTIRGRRVCVIACEFAFLGGTL